MDAEKHLARVEDCHSMQVEHVPPDDLEDIIAGVKVVEITHDREAAAEVLAEYRARADFYAVLGNLYEALIEAGNERSDDLSKAASEEIKAVFLAEATRRGADGFSADWFEEGS